MGGTEVHHLEFRSALGLVDKLGAVPQGVCLMWRRGRRTTPVLHRKSAHLAYGWMTTSPRIFSKWSKSRSRC